MGKSRTRMRLRGFLARAEDRVFESDLIAKRKASKKKHGMRARLGLLPTRRVRWAVVLTEIREFTKECGGGCSEK